MTPADGRGTKGLEGLNRNDGDGRVAPSVPGAPDGGHGRRDGWSESWELRLYVAGHTSRSITALANLQRICDEHLAGRYRIEIIDLALNPQLAHSDQVFALPTLVRKLPTPIRKIIGDLSNTERVLVGLDLRPRRSPM